MMDRKERIQRISPHQLTAFQADLLRKEYSAGTAKNYVRAVCALSTWSGGAVSRSRVLAWKAHLTDWYAPATVNTMLAGVNRFFSFAGWGSCRVKALRLQRRSFRDAERDLDREEYRTLVRTARAQGRERLALVMETLCATGIRVGEVPYITVEALRRGRAEVALKGKIRTILIPGQLCRKLLKYAKKQKIASGEIFLTGGGKRLSRVQIWSEMKHLCRAAGIAERKVFPHNLRHLFARTFYRACRDVVQLADILGHSSVETTRIYLLSTGTEHVRRLERLNLLC